MPARQIAPLRPHRHCVLVTRTGMIAGPQATEATPSALLLVAATTPATLVPCHITGEVSELLLTTFQPGTRLIDQVRMTGFHPGIQNGNRDAVTRGAIPGGGRLDLRQMPLTGVFGIIRE